jgi:hypothetical protein
VNWWPWQQSAHHHQHQHHVLALSLRPGICLQEEQGCSCFSKQLHKGISSSRKSLLAGLCSWVLLGLSPMPYRSLLLLLLLPSIISIIASLLPASCNFLEALLS